MGNIEEGALVMIDFFAPWCGPCKAVAPVYHEIATKTPSSLVTFLKIDCDDCDDIARSFDIQAFPTFKLFRVFPPKKVEGDEEQSDNKKNSLGINVKELYSVKGIPKPFGRVIAEQILVTDHTTVQVARQVLQRFQTVPHFLQWTIHRGGVLGKRRPVSASARSSVPRNTEARGRPLNR